ncbi:ferrochelatase [Cystobacter fuscus]
MVGVLVEDFPDNIFWDLDHLACCLWKAGGPDEMRAFAGRVVALCRGFGNKSELRFRYAHDFLFGYDWARWVAREPGSARASGPSIRRSSTTWRPGSRSCETSSRTTTPSMGRSRAGPSAIPSPSAASPGTRHGCTGARPRGAHPGQGRRLDGERRWELPFTELRAEVAERLGLARDDAS